MIGGGGALGLRNELLMSEFLDWTLPSVLSNLLQALVRSVLLLVVRLLTALIAATIGLIHLS